MTIGDDSYVGFGSSDFTLKSTDVTEDKVTRVSTPPSPLNIRAGLNSSSAASTIPDYAAFDWVIYFTNNGEEIPPIVSDASYENITFRS